MTAPAFILPNGEKVTRLQAAKALKERREMRKHLAPFIKKAFATVDPGAVYKHNWHIDLISEYLTACFYRQILKLIINIPPRFLKSLAATIAFPAWVLGQNPAEQILTSSYSGSLSTKHSVDCRNLIRSLWFQRTFPDLKIVDDQDTKTEFVTTQRGYRVATSVKGTATGKGGNILISDDPIDPFKAHSKTERESTNEWLDSVWSSRKNDPETSIEILIMQRVHKNDPTGHFLEQSDDWEHLVIPQEAPRKTIIDFGSVKVTRNKGDLIHPERFGPDRVAEAKVRLGSYGFAGQHQQTPTPEGGGIIKIDWFGRYDVLPIKPKRIIQSWDTASKEKELNNPSVCLTFYEIDGAYLLADVFKRKVEYPELKRNFKLQYENHSPKPSAVLVEDKSSGMALIQEAKKHTTIPVIPIQPHGEKVSRMAVQSPKIEAGLVLLPNKAPWLVEFEEMILNFPQIDEMDIIDALSQFLDWTENNSISWADSFAVGASQIHGEGCLT